MTVRKTRHDAFNKLDGNCFRTPQTQNFPEVPFLESTASSSGLSTVRDPAVEQPLPLSPLTKTPQQAPCPPLKLLTFVRAPTKSTQDAQDILIRIYDVLGKSRTLVSEPAHECVMRKSRKKHIET